MAVLAFHAVASLGGAVTTVNPPYTPGELAGQIRVAGARLLLTVPLFLAAAREAAAQAGEVPKAFVVRRADAGADDLMAFVAARVAPHKEVRAVEFVDQLPKSQTGKLLRRVLIDQERRRAQPGG